MVEVFERSTATLAARLVLLALADRAHDDGSNAYPSIETLAAAARVEPRTVQRALRQLERLCEIVPVGRTKWGTTVYHLAVVSPLSAPAGGDKMSPKGSSSRTVQSSGGRMSPDYGGRDRRPPGGRMPPLGEWEPVLEPADGLAFRLEQWRAWSTANPDATHPDLLDYRLDTLAIPSELREALVREHLTQKPTTRRRRKK